MKEEVLRKLTLEVNNDCWKRLKILSIQKEVTLQQCVRDLLEKLMNKKNMQEVEVNE